MAERRLLIQERLELAAEALKVTRYSVERPFRWLPDDPAPLAADAAVDTETSH